MGVRANALEWTSSRGSNNKVSWLPLLKFD